MFFGEELREEREKLGLSRDVLADKAGVARSTLQRIEGGENTSLKTIKKLNDALEALRNEKG